MNDKTNMLETPDLNQERLNTLKQLYPDLFTGEGKLNTDEIQKLIDPEDAHTTERFEFKWFGKSNAKRTAFTHSKATLQYDEESSVNPEFADGNMIIEGENLETLKVLLSAYREKIKCIYIDPPYNKGKDYVYSDRWDENKADYWEHIGVTKGGIKVDTNTDSSGRYHSNWLNLMYTRLLIARHLLNEDGVIFISIDDVEVYHLRKMCNEVFGDENFVAQFIWKSRQNKDNRNTTGASIDHEYIICYSKSNDQRALRGDERKTNQYFNPDNDSRGDWNSGNMVGLLPKDLRPNCHYDLLNPVTNINYGKPAMGWRYDKNTMNRLIEENRILWPKSKSGRPRRKVFLSELKDEFTGFSSIVGENIYTRNGTSEIVTLFGKKVFDFPKPSILIAALIEQILKDDEIILDFFAGSGSTAHAVMGLNKEDGGKRIFVLVQLPELTDERSEAYNSGYKKISEITIERNKRVIEQLTKEAVENPGLFKVPEQKFGFKVYKLVKSNFPRVDFKPDPNKTDEENETLLKDYIKEKEAAFINLTNTSDILDEVLIKNGFILNYKLEKVEAFKTNTVYLADDNNRTALISLDLEIKEETYKELKNHKDIKFICLEQSLSTQMKWNLKKLLGDYLVAF